MTTTEKEIKYKQVVKPEEVEELKKTAEEVTKVFNEVVEVNSLNDWYNTRRKFIEELKNNTLLKFNKQVVQQIKDEEVKKDEFVYIKAVEGNKLIVSRNKD